MFKNTYSKTSRTSDGRHVNVAPILTLRWVVERFGRMKDSLKRLLPFPTTLLFLLISFSTYSQSIRSKDQYGKKLFYVENQTIKSNQFGEKLFYFDGNTICKFDKYGERLIYIDGTNVTQQNKYGERLYYFDGICVKYKDKYGKNLFYIDGHTIVDKYGKKIFYYEGILEKWIIICLIKSL